MINAKEGRDVATADVKAAYYYANMEDFVILKLAVEAVDIMCQVNSKYKKFVVVEHVKKVLYLQSLKALYGCVQSALLWYELFTGTLVNMGFKLNPYDPCVANSQSKGSNAPLHGTSTTTRSHMWTLQWLPTSLRKLKPILEK
jgi:hypothetical protein